MKEDERERLLREKLEAVILARLSVGDAPTSRAGVSKALRGMLARRFGSVEWRQRDDSALAAPCASGQLEPTPRSSRARLPRSSASPADSAPPSSGRLRSRARNATYHLS